MAWKMIPAMENGKTLQYNVRCVECKEYKYKITHFRAFILHCESENWLVRRLAHWDQEDRQAFLVKMGIAKKMWECNSCFEYKLKSLERDYVECPVCTKWYHMTCENVFENDTPKEEVTAAALPQMPVQFVNSFICSKCK